MTARADATDIASSEPRIVVSRQGTTSTIQVQGAWDRGAEERMQHAILEALGRPPESVLLDLSRANSMDTRGIAMVVALARRCTCQNVRLVIVPGPAGVHRLFQASEIAQSLPFVGGL